jgi:methylthioribose-1-phosphate isomerase
MKINGKHFKTIWFDKNELSVKIIDQTKLPHQFTIKSIRSCQQMVEAIANMEVRGAPLIGGAAAYGMALSLLEKEDVDYLKQNYEKLLNSRPTAVNLKWAIDRMMSKLSLELTISTAIREAEIICNEDISYCKRIGENGLKIIEDIYAKKKETVNILTHCNAGWLATIDWGTATSPIYHAHKKGIPIHVWVDETRPRNQGANLTSYELNEEEVPNTIIADNTGGILMQRKEVDVCIVGSDRTLLNGDVCNKVGTYLKALAAYDNKIPFYVCLPTSTIDWKIENFDEIPIEERNSKELSHIFGINKKGEISEILIYPKNSKAKNIAFDITPAKYVTGLITENGICKADKESIEKINNIKI